MKIAIPVSNNDSMAGTFGRAERFAVYDDQTNNFEYISNSINLNAAHGAGIQAATTLVNNGVNTVLSPRIGPKAFKVLESSGIKCYHVQEKELSITEIIDKHKSNSFEIMEKAQV